MVGAAISLKESFNELGGIYERRTGTKVTFTFGSSGEMEKQIEAGAPVDVFASAAEKEMDELQAKNLIDRATRSRLRAQLSGSRGPHRLQAPIAVIFRP